MLLGMRVITAQDGLRRLIKRPSQAAIAYGAKSSSSTSHAPRDMREVKEIDGREYLLIRRGHSITR